VTDYQHRAFVALEPALQPHQGVQVEVVGRLVEKQEVGRTHQRPCQLQAHPPAAGEAVDRMIQFGGLETQAEDQRLRTRLRIVCAGVVQAPCRRGASRSPSPLVFGQAHFLPARRARRCRRLDHEVGGALRWFPASPAGPAPGASRQRSRELAGVLVQAAVEQRETASILPAPLRPTRPTRSPVLMVTEVVEQDPGAAAQADAFEGDHAAGESPVQMVARVPGICSKRAAT
jgi:hypothetical protein